MTAEMTDVLPAMTGAEMLATREYLGFSRQWLARHMVLNERRLKYMEDGVEPIPDAVVTVLDRATEDARALVHQLVGENRRKVKAATGTDVVFLRTYRNADEYAGKYCPQWHRMVCARVVESCPGLALTYDPV